MSGQGAVDEDRVAVTLPASGTSPRESRRFVAKQLELWGLSQCTDALVLLVSELVTNALLHARTDMTVSMARGANSTILLEVTDGSPALPAQRRYSQFAGTGRGLNMVATMSAGWGVRVEGQGKTVWVIVSYNGHYSGGDSLGAFDVDSVDAL
jgi:hypothetical protein